MLSLTNRTSVLIALLFYLYPSVLKTGCHGIDIRALKSETSREGLKPFLCNILDPFGLLNSYYSY